MTNPPSDPNSHPAAELLFQCLKTDWAPAQAQRLAQLSDDEWQTLVDWAQTQKLAPLLYYRLRQQGFTELMPESLRHQAKAQYKYTAMRNLKLYHHLRHLLCTLQEQDIPVIVLKGTYLAGNIYEEITLRQMADVDLLVPPTALKRALTVITNLGYQPAQPIGALEPILRYHHHLPNLLKTGELNIELHWNITKPNLSYTIDVAELWERARPATVAGVDVHVLSPEDLLLHICHHAIYQHYLEQDIRFLCDIDVICRRCAPVMEWETLVHRARQWGWERGVYLALQLAADLLDAPIPPAVLPALCDDPSANSLSLDAKLRLHSERKPQGHLTSLEFCEAWQEERLTRRVQKALKRIFVPRDLLAYRYGVPANSPHIYLYYPVRLLNLLMRYGTMMCRVQSQPAEQIVLERKATLIEWLYRGSNARIQSNP